MISLPERIEVSCPKCGELFADWDRLEFDPATSSTCPNCGYQLADDAAVYQEGVWQSDVDDREALEH